MGCHRLLRLELGGKEKLNLEEDMGSFSFHSWIWEKGPAISWGPNRKAARWPYHVVWCSVPDGNKCQPRTEGGKKTRENGNSRVGGTAQRG